MAKRVTILIDEGLDKKLRELQAKQIMRTQKSVSYSKIVNDTLRKKLN